MRAVVFANGTIENYRLLATHLRPDDTLVAADGGAVHCLALSKLPHAVVGDLDSLSPTTLTELTASGVVIERHPIAKDQTDIELAIEWALRAGASEVLLVGATGGRLDQTLGNLLILAQRCWPVPLKVLDGDQLAQLLRGGESVVIKGVPGQTVSVIPLTAQVTGITYEGLAYPLSDATLALGSTRGISNLLAQERATITIKTGLLIVIVAG